MSVFAEARPMAEVNASRAHPRFQVNSRVRLHWTDWSNEECDVACSCEGMCVDVAIGGIGIHTANEFLVGDVVGVEFIDSPLPIYQARIVYRNGDDYGLQFLNMV